MKQITALALIAALTACGDGGAAVTLEDGSGVRTSTSGKGLAAPDNLPPFAPLFKGAKVDNTVLNAKEPHKGVVAYTVEAKADDVIAFYRAKGEAGGLKAAQEMNTSGSRMLVMARTALGGEDVGMQVNVMPSLQSDRHVTVTLVYSGDPGS